MTPTERQALREKHKPMDDGDGGFYCNYCREEDNGDAWYGLAMGVEWPCDVIKVLDAWEANSKKALDALNHINTMRVDEDDFEWLETAEHILNGDA